MKKLMFIAAFLMSLTTYAQNGEMTPGQMQSYTAQLVGKTLDTVVNADTTYLVFTAATAGYNMHIVGTVTKITGTVAGAICLMGTDVSAIAANSAWDTLNNVIAGPTASNYSNYYTVGDATASYEYFYVGPTPYKYKYYRLRYISSGTQTSSFSGITYYRKP